MDNEIGHGPLNIVWTFPTHGLFEYDWIKEICSSFQINEIVDDNYKFDFFSDLTLIVVANMTDNKFIPYLESFVEKKMRFLVLHVSDEINDHNISYYDKFRSRVMRMYYSQKYIDQYGILTLPIGYKRGVKRHDVQKRYLVNFIGQGKVDRWEMVNTYQMVEPKFIRWTYQWDDPNGLSTEEYSKSVSESMYTLCPTGCASFDTFRVNEAMECGSVPVSVEYNGINYFDKIYGPNPVIVGKSWIETIELIKNTNFQEKQKEIEIWWNNKKEQVKDTVRNRMLSEIIL